MWSSRGTNLHLYHPQERRWWRSKMRTNGRRVGFFIRRPRISRFPFWTVDDLIFLSIEERILSYWNFGAPGLCPARGRCLNSPALRKHTVEREWFSAPSIKI